MQSSQPVARPARTSSLADVFVGLAVALVTWWLVVVWAIVRRPILRK
jgi:VanZ family protein